MTSKIRGLTDGASADRVAGVARGAIVAFAALVAMGSTVGRAQAAPHALLIEDANTGAVLLNQDGDEPRHPASLTKMMTLYLTFEALSQGRITMSTRIKISEHAANAAPSKLELSAGSDIALQDAIQALVTKSANDVAIAVAEHIGGSEANFARLMTEKAHALGMKNTTFKNASGLPDPAQLTTARDMTTLGLRLYDDFPRYFPLFSTRSFTYNGSTMHNHNTLMLQMPGINGIKTGYTAGSGFNLVSSYQADGKHLVGAIFGGESAALRNVEMRVALQKMISRASTVKTRRPAVQVSKAAPRPVPAPVPAVRKPKPEPAPAQVASAASPVPAATGPAPLKIEVARVRQVAMPTAPSAGAAIAVQGQPQPIVEAPRKPSPFEQQMASQVSNMVPAETASTTPPSVVAAAAVQAAAAPPTVAPHPVAGTRPPSSLNAQLASLTSGPATAQSALAPPSYRLQGPTPTPTVTTGALGKYEIQIGAYASAVEAEKRLAAAAQQVPGALEGHMATRQTVTLNDKVLYRARFTGFDASAAASACSELNRRSINCIAIKAE